MTSVGEHPSRELVIAAYMCLLGRAPESEETIALYKTISIQDFLNALLYSEEFALKSGRNPLYHYNSDLSCEALILQYANRDAKAEDTICVNFLGTRINPDFLPAILTPMIGIVDRIPIPGNWHADIAEWGSVLRAVDLAKDSFRMLELGCGWGCWMVNSGVAARAKGLNVFLSGVEADAGHIAFAREACHMNNFKDNQFTLTRGIVAAKPGQALFPRQTHPGQNWGNEPIFNVSPDEFQRLTCTNAFDLLPTITLAQATSNQILDLLHMDIQGGEFEFVSDTMRELNSLCRYLVIGTHSRAIEGNLFTALLANEWVLEVERPAIISLNAGTPLTLIDGVQGWRNSRTL